MQTTLKLEPAKEFDTFFWKSEGLKILFDFEYGYMPKDVELSISGVTGLDLREALANISGEDVEIYLGQITDSHIGNIFEELFIQTHYAEVLEEFLRDYYNNMSIFLKQNFQSLPDSTKDYENYEELLKEIFPRGSNISFDYLVSIG